MSLVLFAKTKLSTLPFAVGSAAARIPSSHRPGLARLYRQRRREMLALLLLGAEYPAPELREQVESLLQRKSISWYGHGELAVLAYERELIPHRP